MPEQMAVPNGYNTSYTDCTLKRRQRDERDWWIFRTSAFPRSRIP